MQVSIETLTGLERRMTIEVPAEEVESQVRSRLQEAAKTFNMKGFRKGKVPVKVIKNRFGEGVRQEVVGEVISQSWVEAVTKENVKPAGQPSIEPKNLEEGQNLEFIATFEVYPEIELKDFSAVTIEKKQAEILDTDIDKMIETLREQRKIYKEVDRKSQEGDQVNIDFVGTLDGEKFDGGEAKGTKLILGSKRMIPGFEEGLVGVSSGDNLTLPLTFPEDYQNKELAGKEVEFAITVNNVSEPTLPELDDEFFASFDVAEGGLEAFRTEVRANMTRELKNANRNNIKNQVIEGLLEIHEVDAPKALVANEINGLRQQAMQQFGGGKNIDPSMLPDDLFAEQAKRRVILSLVMSEIVSKNDLKPDADTVRGLIEEMAESYEKPEDVIKWYYSDKEQLANIEAMALEDAVIDMVIDKAKVTESSVSYEEALKPVAKPEPATAKDKDKEGKGSKDKKAPESQAKEEAEVKADSQE
ncbi:MAG: trigger factor [Gammaproteobacteria bacterium]|nr:trigger factor [Gammaproteobacteria bacterium]